MLLANKLSGKLLLLELLPLTTLKIGFDSCIYFFKKNYDFSKNVKFSHGAIYDLPNNIKIVGCYHPSPRNVNTGRINEKKMTSLFKKVLKLA